MLGSESYSLKKGLFSKDYSWTFARVSVRGSWRERVGSFRAIVREWVGFYLWGWG